MSIWKHQPTLNELRDLHTDTAERFLGIEFVEIGEDFLKARMPVDHRTMQPFRILHGGASALLAESVGSCAANLCVDQREAYCVGLDINANHVRGARGGWVTGTARPLHIGGSTHVWEIRIADEADNLVCIARLTMSVRRRPEKLAQPPATPAGKM
jgi:1,4-dihydroxy-2-naphthoyl-CoA hydrolase